MTAIVVSNARSLEGVDPAAVWALVADPSKVQQWAPVVSAGYIGTELPAVGHTVFLSRRRRTDTQRAWRCRIVEWEAGHRYVCEMDSPGAAKEQRIEVVVDISGSAERPETRVRITYRGEVPQTAALLYRLRIAALERRALSGVAATVEAS